MRPFTHRETGILGAILTDDRVRAIDALNDRINRDERVENVLLPIRDGIMLAYKR